MSLRYLVVGLLVGGLAGSAIDASALVSDGAQAGAAAKQPPSKTKKAAPKKKSKKPKAKKKKAKKRKPAPAPAAPSTGVPLVGLFRLNPGAFSAGRASGSYVRLVLPGGSVARGPFFVNPNSRATTYTLLNPGRDGGLRTGAFQEQPAPPFAGLGDSRADRIIAPQRFAFILYGLSTAARDPQTGRDVPPPSITVTDGRLGGQLQALTASWNKQFFNQGSPKPDGSSPGLTSPVTGTYNAESKAYTLEWTSQVVGGPFNNFSGVWHLEGTFEPSCA